MYRAEVSQMLRNTALERQRNFSFVVSCSMQYGAQRSHGPYLTSLYPVYLLITVACIS